jgi:multiple sugar transport system permease protein
VPSKPGRPESSVRRFSDRQFAYLLVIPLVAFEFALVLYPMTQSFLISLNTYDVSGTKPTYVALQNYIDAFRDPYVQRATIVSMQFAITVVAMSVLIGLGVALLLNEEMRGRAIARVMALLPWAIPEFSVGIIFSYIFSNVLGTLNGLLYTLGLIKNYTSFLNPDLAVYIVALAFVWHYSPLASFFFLGAVQTIPADLYKQAKVDGAGMARRFRVVTLRYLRYPLLIVLVLATVEALRAFDIIFVLTYGGPAGSTSTLSYLIYTETFRTLQMGYGATISWYLVLVTFIVTSVYFVLIGRWR